MSQEPDRSAPFSSREVRLSKKRLPIPLVPKNEFSRKGQLLRLLILFFTQILDDEDAEHYSTRHHLRIPYFGSASRHIPSPNSAAMPIYNTRYIFSGEGV